MSKRSRSFQMTIKELTQQRERFQPAPGVTSIQTLSLREKQALIDEILRGMPIKQIAYSEQGKFGNSVYLVTKGWPQITAILEFVDGKFPTWTDEEKQAWEQSQN